MKPKADLLEAFQLLNQKKRSDPDKLTEQEWGDWRRMRTQLEQALFDATLPDERNTRKSIRVPTSLHVRYWSSDEIKDRYIQVLSEGGLFVATLDPLPVGTRLDLRIGLASREFDFKVQGEVIWISKTEELSECGMGVRFVDLSYQQKRIIYELVDDTLRARMLERRTFGRIAARLRTQLVYADGAFDLRSQDIGLGGIFLETEHPLARGERVLMTLHLNDSAPPIQVEGEVVRVVQQVAPGQHSGMGVRFIDLDPVDRKRISEFLVERVTRFEDSFHPGENPERRRHLRLEKRIKVVFHAAKSFKVRYTCDLSRGGVFVQTHEPPPMGSTVEVTLIHPVSLQRLRVIGQVVRVCEADANHLDMVPGVGVAFERMPVDQQGLLDDILQAYARFDESDAEEFPDGSPI